MGQLLPCGLIEVLPGDVFQHSSAALIRVTPMIAPLMHPVTVRLHHFFCPTRILWDGWENFITGGPDNSDASVIPTVTTTLSANSVLDYMGVPHAAPIRYPRSQFALLT